MTSRVVAIAVVSVIAVSGTAAAQGRGGGRGKARQPTAPIARGGTQTSTSAAVVQLSPSSPQFGTWLDDATTAARGTGWAVFGATYWRGSAAEQIDAPILGMTYGITNRVQLSATVPFYRLDSEGFSTSGLDTVSISSKFAIVNPDGGSTRFGLAVGAVAEILSGGFGERSRAHWAVPVTMEVRAHRFRLYASTGYFSRGAFFAAGALELTVPTGTSMTASFAHSVSVDGVTVSTQPTVSTPTLRDVSLFVSHPVSTIASIYVGGSRTFSGSAFDSASSLSGGISVRFAGS